MLEELKPSWKESAISWAVVVGGVTERGSLLFWEMWIIGSPGSQDPLVNEEPPDYLSTLHM